MPLPMLWCWGHMVFGLSIRTFEQNWCKDYVRAITFESYGICSWNFTGDWILSKQCVANKNDNSRCFGFLRYLLLLITSKRYGIYYKTSRVGSSHWNTVLWIGKTTVSVLVFWVTYPWQNPYPYSYSWTIKKFFTKLHINVYLTKTICYVQERQL